MGLWEPRALAPDPDGANDPISIASLSIRVPS